MNQVEFRRARLHDSRMSDARLPTRGAAAGSASGAPVTEARTEIVELASRWRRDLEAWARHEHNLEQA